MTSERSFASYNPESIWQQSGQVHAKRFSLTREFNILSYINSTEQFGTDNPGIIHFSLHFVHELNQVVITCIDCHNIGDDRATVNIFLRLHMMTSAENRLLTPFTMMAMTHVKTNTRHPSFEGPFDFNFPPEEFDKLILKIEVCSSKSMFRLDEDEVLGGVSVPLYDMDVFKTNIVSRTILKSATKVDPEVSIEGERPHEGASEGALETIPSTPPLLPQGCTNSLADNGLRLRTCLDENGGLSMNIDRVFAIGKCAGTPSAPDCYVKIYLVQAGNKSTRECDLQQKQCAVPVFNHTFTFELSTNEEELRHTRITITVLQRRRATADVDIVGSVILGDGSTEYSEMEHWRELVQYPGVSCVRWHTLHNDTRRTDLTLSREPSPEDV